MPRWPAGTKHRSLRVKQGNPRPHDCRHAERHYAMRRTVNPRNNKFASRARLATHEPRKRSVCRRVQALPHEDAWVDVQRLSVAPVRSSRTAPSSLPADGRPAAHVGPTRDLVWWRKTPRDHADALGPRPARPFGEARHGEAASSSGCDEIADQRRGRVELRTKQAQDRSRSRIERRAQKVRDAACPRVGQRADGPRSRARVACWVTPNSSAAAHGFA